MILLIVTVTISIGLSYIFPEPFNRINVIIVFMILWLFKKPSGAIVWFSFFSFYIIDLVTLAPFGISLFAGTFSMLLVYWTYRFVLSNRSIISVTALTFIAVFVYRILYILVYNLYLYINDSETIWSELILATSVESILTSLVVFILYFVLFYRKNKAVKSISKYGFLS